MDKIDIGIQLLKDSVNRLEQARLSDSYSMVSCIEDSMLILIDIFEDWGQSD